MTSAKTEAPRSDVHRFAGRLPVIVLAAVVAQFSGDIGSALFRALTGVNGLGSGGLLERLLVVAFALAPATLILSHWFGAKPWSWAEGAVVALSTLLSFWTGPLLYALGNSLFMIVSGGHPISLRGNYLTSLFWAAGIAVAMAPAEYFVWSSSARMRMRAIYSRIRRQTSDLGSEDPRRAASVRRDLRRVSRVETSDTARLSAALRGWYALWLDHPEGTFDKAFAEPAAAVDREVEALYGSSDSRHRQSRGS